MVRFVLRLTFWAFLVVAVLPGARKSGVYNGELGVETVTLAVQATLLDLSNFCSRNISVCDTGLVALTRASDTAKESLLTAYNGVRNQYNDPDTEIITGSVKKPD